MESFIQFIQQYWQFISAGIIILIEVLLLIFKKTKIIDPSIYAKLVSLVEAAEKEFGPGNGESKLNWVLTMFKSTSEVPYSDRYIKEVVEKILTTPHKKG